MPLSEEQERWVSVRESERIKQSEQYAAQLFEAFQAKQTKNKNKDKEKEKGNKDSKRNAAGKNANQRKQVSKSVASNQTTAISSKYKSASDFMYKHFPDFEHADDLKANDIEEIDFEHGKSPMRIAQLLECAHIRSVMQDYDMNIKEGVLERALVIPQDRPEVLCLEAMREDGDRLMKNPLPVNYWRKFNKKK
jgi:hypothetical protein